jgi:hypothetical protein
MSKIDGFSTAQEATEWLRTLHFHLWAEIEVSAQVPWNFTR